MQHQAPNVYLAPAYVTQQQGYPSGRRRRRNRHKDKKKDKKKPLWKRWELMLLLTLTGTITMPIIAWIQSKFIELGINILRDAGTNISRALGFL